MIAYVDFFIEYLIDGLFFIVLCSSFDRCFMQTKYPDIHVPTQPWDRFPFLNRFLGF